MVHPSEEVPAESGIGHISMQRPTVNRVSPGRRSLRTPRSGAGPRDQCARSSAGTSPSDDTEVPRASPALAPGHGASPRGSGQTPREARPRSEGRKPAGTGGVSRGARAPI